MTLQSDDDDAKGRDCFAERVTVRRYTALKIEGLLEGTDFTCTRRYIWPSF